MHASVMKHFSFNLCQIIMFSLIKKPPLMVPSVLSAWLDKSVYFILMETVAIQPAFLVKRSSNLELLHRNSWKILTRKAASFGINNF